MRADRATGVLRRHRGADEIGRIMEADFDTLDDALAVLDAESFQSIKAATESLAPTFLLYEHREI